MRNLNLGFLEAVLSDRAEGLPISPGLGPDLDVHTCMHTHTPALDVHTLHTHTHCITHCIYTPAHTAYTPAHTRLGCTHIAHARTHTPSASPTPAEGLRWDARLHLYKQVEVEPGAEPSGRRATFSHSASRLTSRRSRAPPGGNVR